MPFNPFSKLATKPTSTSTTNPTEATTEREPVAAPTPTVSAGDAGGVTEMTSDKSYKKMGEDDGGHVEHDGLAAVETAASVREGKVYRTYRRRWFGLVQLVLLNIIVSWDWLTFAPVAESAAKYYRVSQTDINWLSTAFMLAFPVVAPLTIKILHWGPKPSIMTSAGLVLVGNWVRYAGSHKFTPEGGKFGVVMFGQILTGLAQPFVLAAPTRYSDMWFTTRGRVAATAVTSLANPLGAALGQLIVPELVPGGKSEQVSRMVLYVAIISSVASIPSFFIPAAPPTPVAASSEHPRPSLRASLRQVARSLELWLVLGAFAIYVGLFNNISTVLVQMTKPHGFTEEEAGIGGAVLILVGLAAAAVSSPILDRKKTFVLAIKLVIPFNGLMYLVFVWMPEHGGVPGTYVVLALIGAAGFSLVPCALELLTELSYPVSPEVASTIAWAGGQLLGAIFIIVSGALTAGKDADPPENLDKALIFQAVIALAAVPLPIMLGMFGREEKIRLRRVKSDEEGLRLAAMAAP